MSRRREGPLAGIWRRRRRRRSGLKEHKFHLGQAESEILLGQGEGESKEAPSQRRGTRGARIKGSTGRADGLGQKKRKVTSSSKSEAKKEMLEESRKFKTTPIGSITEYQTVKNKDFCAAIKAKLRFFI